MFDRDGLRVCALGTGAGEPLADGDVLAAGVHLRWQVLGDLGFPSVGFSIFRRPASTALHCRPLGDNWSQTAPDNADWVGGVLFQLAMLWRANGGPVRYDDGALYLPGERVLELRPDNPLHAIALRFAGDGPAPEAEALEVDSDVEAVVATGRARAAPDGGSYLELRADHIDVVRIRAVDIRLIEACYAAVGAPAPAGWGVPLSLPGGALLLPVVRQGTANESANVVPARAAASVARGRLSATLPVDTLDRAEAAFKAELYPLLVGLLAADTQSDALVESAGKPAATVRPAPTLGLRTLDLLALAAADPDVARVLGLYWHDPVTTGRYDYQVVGHWGAMPWPGRRTTPDELREGDVLTRPFSLESLTIVSPRPVAVVAATTGGPGDLALRFTTPLFGTVPVSVRLDASAPAATIEFDDADGGVVRAWRGAQQVFETVIPGGAQQLTIDNADGLDLIGLYGDCVVRAVTLRPHPGPVGDLSAFTYDHGPTTPRDPRRVDVTLAQEVPAPRAAGVDGRAEPDAGTVAIRVARADGVRDVHAPVTARVTRRATDGAATHVNPGRPLAMGLPALPDATDGAGDLPEGWPPGGWHLLDDAVPRGDWTYDAVGIDLFGRMAAAGASLTAGVGAAHPPPPPPIAVHARLLDPRDRWLADDERALADADGPGLHVSFIWPGERRLQAPGLEDGGTFRVWLRDRDPSHLTGYVSLVLDRGTTSELVTDRRWLGATDALAGSRVKVGGTWFDVVGNTHGENASVLVGQLADPLVRPQPGAFVLSMPPRGPLAVDLANAAAWDRTVHAFDVPAIPCVTATIAGAAVNRGVIEVTLAAAVPADATLVPGVFVAQGAVWQAMRHEGQRLTLRPAFAPDGTRLLPVTGANGSYWPGLRLEAWLPGIGIEMSAGEGAAVGLVGIQSVDRFGGGGPVSPAVRVTTARYDPPAAVAVSLPPPVDGDIPAGTAEPADFTGIARYLRTWAAAPGATGYNVLRCTTAELFFRDREQRRTGSGHYASADRPFDATDTDSADWLAEHYPMLTEDDLQVADLSAAGDPATVSAAWQDWAAWYYPRQRNSYVMGLAERDGNEAALRRVNNAPVDAPTYTDQFNGRGAGTLVYRVQSVDAAGNLGELSPALPLVRYRDVTPPATPAIQSVYGAERGVAIGWRANAEADLAEYRVWRSDDLAALADIRRLAPHAVVSPAPDARIESWTDADLPGGSVWHYRLAAADAAGNVSPPTAILTGRAVATVAPQPPLWEVVQWVKVDLATGDVVAWDAAADAAAYAPAVQLRCLATEAGMLAAFERQADRALTWTTVAGWLPPLAPDDPLSDDARRFEALDTTAPLGRTLRYRVRLQDAFGNVNTVAFVPASLEPP